MSRGGTPQALMAARLAESGIPAKGARLLRLEALSAAQVRRLDPSFKPYPAMRIPYFNEKRRATGFYRLRYLGEMLGLDALRGKALRYVQAPGTGAEAYLPPIEDWKALARDASRALFITEGELKAAAACACGYPTIGLGGVWSWRSARTGDAFLPALAGFEWRGRQVYLVFDSDYATNPQVMRALIALARELTARGAMPSIVALPDLPSLEEAGKKTGLDDFLMAHGKAALDALVESAEPFSASRELWRLNEEVVYIRNPGLVVALADGRKMAAGAFKEHAYANRHYHEIAFDSKGNEKQVKKPLAPAWLAWEERAELERLTYKPGEESVVNGQYNYWPGWGAEPKHGDISLWSRLLDYTFAGDAAARHWFERWCAYPIQNPGKKLYAASVFWGPTHGTGKSLIGYSLGACYGKNFSEISDQDLGASFNAWAENKQFVLGDDVTGQEYKRATMELLKFIITRQTLMVNAKYMPAYEVPDCINYFFTSNFPDSFILEDTDRRYFVWEMPSAPMPREFYDKYDAWKASGRMASALLWHFMHLPLGDFNPRAHAHETNAKRAMVLDGKSDIGAWIARLKESPDDVLRMGGIAIKAELMTNAQLLMLYDPEDKKRVTANGLGREMKKAGFRQVNGGLPIKTAKGPQRLYAVRNQSAWKKLGTPAGAGQHWDANFALAGPNGKKKRKF